VESGRFMNKKLEVKISCYCSFKASFWFPDKQTVLKIFLKPSWAEEQGLESSGIGRRLRKVAELRKTNFEGPQSQFHNFF
jgi:hypothetical protein